MTAASRTEPPAPPPVFQIARELAPRRYPLLVVFPGLDRVPAFRKYPGTPRDRARLAQETTVEIARRRGEWMYVAPHRVPPDADDGWRPITARGDCVVVSGQHLRRSPALVLYLDILHELYHVVQRSQGRELWDEAYSYVDRPTELEAYRFGNEEARRLGATDSFLRDYLRVDWVSEKEHRRLLTHLDVRPA
jgi:hypothetical protein